MSSLAADCEPTGPGISLSQRVSRIANSDLSLGEILGQIVGLAAGISRCDACLIYLRETATGDFVLRASQLPFSYGAATPRLKLGEGMTGWVAEHQTYVALSDKASSDLRFKALAALVEDTYEALLSVPLINRGRTIGVINIHHRDPHHHSEEEISFFGFIGEQLSSAIAKSALEDENARLADQSFLRAEEREQAEKARAFLASIVESSEDSIIGTDLNGQIISWNRASERLFGYSASEAIGNQITLIFEPGHQHEAFAALEKVKNRERIDRFEALRVGKGGMLIEVSAILAAVRDASGQVYGMCANYRDISARKRANREREELEVQLRHALKLESIGQLAAGIAHEINTPAQYIGDNSRFLKEAFQDVERLFRSYQGLLTIVNQNDLTCQAANDVLALARSVDEEYLMTEIPKAIDQTIEGIDRVSTLVTAMKEFSHPGVKEKALADLNRGIRNTITVARNEWKYVAEMEIDCDPALPLVPCLLGDFNQVILNLIVNAAHAISDVVQNGQLGRITVRTKNCQNWAEINVEDTGAGIPEHARDHIFEPFFTTKEVGRGTGQGLAIARSVVVDKHGGTIHFVTETGKGTTFTIRLPLDGACIAPRT